MLNLKDGTLWQWDIGRKMIIALKEGSTIDKVQFYNGIGDNAYPATSIEVVDGEILAGIPNSLLCYANNLTVYLMTTDEDGVKTQEQITLVVNKRAKPEDYIFTDDEFHTYKAYDERLQYLEKNVVVPERLESVVDQEIKEFVPEWAREAIPDKTLSEGGKAADALVVGTNVSNLQKKNISLEREIVVERARIDNLVANTGEQTEGNSELIDARTDGDGTVHLTAGGAVRNNIIDKRYYVYNQELASGENTFAVDIPLNSFHKKLVITNNATADGYFKTIIYSGDKQCYAKTQFISAGESLEVEFIPNVDISSLVITNMNGVKVSTVSFYENHGMSIDKSAEMSNRTDRTVHGIDATYENGYINTSGGITSSSDYLLGLLNRVKSGDIISYTGSFSSWCPVWGYYADGTAVQLLPSGCICKDKKIEIVDESIVSVRACGKLGVEFELKVIGLDTDERVYNRNAYTLNDLTSATIPAASTVERIIGKIVANFSAPGLLHLINSNKVLNVGDKVSCRTKIRANKDCTLKFCIYPTNEEQYVCPVTLKANIEKEVYWFSSAIKTSGTLKVYYQMQDTDYGEEGITFEVLELIEVVNSYDCWIDKATKETLKNYNTTELIVDCNGFGHFEDIDTACRFAERMFDVNVVPVTIRVKNGYYKQKPTNTYPYAPINKGANKISIIGESRDGVVIECYNTSDVQSKVMEIGGPCVIENLTIRSLSDGTYTRETDLGHNCYCIHNDSEWKKATEKYYTVVKNCKLYSECHSPIGAGLHNWQTQRYENVECVSNGFISNGALYIHASTVASDENMALEIDNCVCIAKDGTKALTVLNVSGSLSFEQIPTTIRRTIGVTNGENITDDNFKKRHLMTEDSVLNNVDDWNY